MATINRLDCRNLDDLRLSLFKYVQRYNQSIHGSLEGLTPQDRFFNESDIILRLSDNTIHNAFLLELDRRVSVDNVVIIDNVEYEVSYRFSGQRIKLRYSPDLTKIYVVDKDGELEEIQLLNKHANATLKRVKIKYTGE